MAEQNEPLRCGWCGSYVSDDNDLAVGRFTTEGEERAWCNQEHYRLWEQGMTDHATDLIDGGEVSDG